MTSPSRRSAFVQKVRSGTTISATFQKTPAYEVVEVMATSGLDTMCLDAEHSAFDRARLDACLAIGRALDFPLFVLSTWGTIRPSAPLSNACSIAAGSAEGTRT
ncbi:MAG: hypothetical protein AAGF71_13585, partial [Pseudomonadota bacterium]